MIRQAIHSALFLGLSCSLLAQQLEPGSVPSAAPRTLMDGTAIKLRLSQTISSAYAKVGQEVPFEVIEDIKLDGVVVIPKGTTAVATVTEAEAKKWAGRAGKLNISITYVRLADQEKAALRAMREAKGSGHVGVMTAGMVGTAIVFFPAAPLLLFVHGKDISIPQGTEITAFVEGDMHLDMTKFAAPSPMPLSLTTPAVTMVSLLIDSTPGGADIEVDGGFVGNTPSTVSATPGSHQIGVKKKGFVDWVKTLNVTGGSIHLNAELEAVPAH